jgi:two-component system osmolarity sensor histidine kinase EnvZ
MSQRLKLRLLSRLQRLLPHSLLWSTFILLAFLMLLSVAAWFAIFSRYEREPRARQLAQTLVSVANLTRVTLLSAREDARFGVLRELSDREGIHIYPSDETDEVAPLPNDPFLKHVLEHVRESLGEQTRLSLRRNGENGLFVSFRIVDGDEEEFWVVLPRERIEHRFPVDWIGWGLAVVLLSLLGAWLIVLHISRPLGRLALAARKVGAGETPPKLPEDGPDELATVSRAFNQMHADLAQLDQDRALVLAGISHDLRTPLTRLRMGIEMTTDEGMREGMTADVEEMDKTISQFLDFARAESGEPVQLIALHALLENIVSGYQRRQVNVTLTASENSGDASLLCHPQAFRRAVMNLIDNALRYAPGSPVEIMVDSKPEGIDISVLDHGPGIPEGEVDRLKRPFTRLETARSNVVGAGLGLAIVERIMRSHGGRFDLLPRPEGGLIARLSFSSRTK